MDGLRVVADGQQQLFAQPAALEYVKSAHRRLVAKRSGILPVIVLAFGIDDFPAIENH